MRSSKTQLSMGSRVRNAALSAICSMTLAAGLVPALAIAEQPNFEVSDLSAMAYDEASDYSVIWTYAADYDYQHVAPGSQFTVELAASTTGAALSCCQVEIAYDRTKVSLGTDSIVMSKALKEAEAYDRGDGTAIITFYGNTMNAVNMASLTFTAAAEAAGDPAIVITNVICGASGDLNDANVNYTQGNAAIQIAEAHEEGWQAIEGVGWVFYRDGEMVKGWLDQPEGRYYMNPTTGAMMQDLQTIDGKLYLLRNTVKYDWQQVGSNWYYFQEDGSALKHGWTNIEDSYWFLDDDGKMLQGGWHQIDGYWYYLNNARRVGWHAIAEGWYYFNEVGQMQTGWQTIDGKVYYFAQSGAMRSGWHTIDGSWYYFKNDMKTGWVDDGTGKYYMGTDGKMQTGWITVDGKVYYCKSAMFTGWQTIEGYWYYFGNDGVRVTGTQVIDGKTYNFDDQGRML